MRCHSSGVAGCILEGMSEFQRQDGRAVNEMRPVKIIRHAFSTGEGNVLVSYGNTTVLCNASFEDNVPRWLKGSGRGWVTAEYAMLPRATDSRSPRESVKGKIGGRTHEISRLIGRSLRAVVDLNELGENMITLDCDVLQADGGTRTASITGAYVALADAIAWAKEQGIIPPHAKVLKDSVSAVSVGIVDGVPVLDLPYEEDSRADTDMNIVAVGSGGLVEVQGTAEGNPFSREELSTLLDLATQGNRYLAQLQQSVLNNETPAHIEHVHIDRSEGSGWEQHSPSAQDVRATAPDVIAHDATAQAESLMPATQDFTSGMQSNLYATQKNLPQPTVVVATHNTHKVEEIQAILSPHLPGVQFVSARELDAPEAKENGTTFVENSVIKAEAVAKICGEVTIADDSGLEVEALHGAPGIFSARWAGKHGDDVANRELLLAQLQDCEPEQRKARFACAAVAIAPIGDAVAVTEYMDGHIITEERGQGGFGYDPIFVAGGETRTNAELTADEKDSISHRGKAFRALAPYVAKMLGVTYVP